MEQMQLIGNIGKDAEIKESNGNKFIRFTVACNQVYKDQNNQKIERTNWYNVTTKQMSLFEFLKSGTKVFVQGLLNTSIYRNKDNQNVISLDLMADKIQLISAKKQTEESDQESDDDLPY